MDDFHKELVKEAQQLRDKLLEDSDLRFAEHFKIGNETQIDDDEGLLTNPLASLLGMDNE